MIRTLILAMAAFVLSTPASAYINHICSGGTYYQVEVRWIPFPEPGQFWARITEVGICDGEWTYREGLRVVSGSTAGFDLGISDLGTGRPLPASDPVTVNLSRALLNARPAAQRRVTDRPLSAAEVATQLAQFRAGTQYIIRLPRSFTPDSRCYSPSVWNGFACVDNTLSPATPSIPYTTSTAGFSSGY